MKKYKFLFFIIVIAAALATPAWADANGNTTIQSFSKAKKALLKRVFYDHLETFYCGCPFNMGKQIIPSARVLSSGGRGIRNV